MPPRKPTAPRVGSPNWANQTIWTGDNLDIMRGMNSASEDLIYLDPPFNSNHNYAAPIGSQAAGAAFKDTWGLDDINLAWHGEIKHEYPGLYSLLTVTREIHGDSMMSYLIYMAIRVMEMRRLLKPTGSLYLHCDPYASHYLKLLLDTLFAARNYRNEVVWRRYGSHNDAQRYRRVHDVLLFYGRDNGRTWNGAWNPLDPDYVKQAYRHKDDRGRYRTAPLHTGGLSGGGYGYDFRGFTRTWRYSEERMHEIEAAGLIAQARNGQGVPERKVYLHDSKGRPVADIWDDVSPLTGQHKERVGYPTQKPVVLLTRIVRASSNAGDMILDPFCGCATACIAAEMEGREWVGIDISEKAADLVRSRLKDEVGLFYQGAHREDIPARTDLGKVIPYNHADNRAGSHAADQRLLEAA